ncbi:hypothetical protein NEUTE1DRAFT_51934 [Neurospora tetrasperma FGSC 2508]|uniref:Uncharacterized protein n=1 Tax=Neurospora tetrasperma (strain FGSC 2508 / ATCC MYA-4615 / P0657) TaxID=510951 RepID=F8N154_NEUT8|nr:uncharacterized protein NEUTE1DRAFT_51934 [Neurospora tetrasperma FGSC 2508]EGO53087.1 hypothetical protein NEUTE1DRAFT_51934 [Neurospora tetrasperma FGSC 2508]
MLVRRPPPFGVTLGIVPRCFPRSVPVTMTTIPLVKTTPTQNVVAIYHGAGPSQSRWQLQHFRPMSSGPLPQAQNTPAVAEAARTRGGKGNSSWRMMQIVHVRLASTSTRSSSEVVQNKKGGNQAQARAQGQVQAQGQTQLRPTAANGVPQLKAPNLEYPERLLIYNAGKGKIIFIALLKLTTVLIFSAFGLFVAPAYIVNGSPLAGVASLFPPSIPPILHEQTSDYFPVFTCGLTPFLFLAHSSRPFVAQIHLTKLPPYARLSSDVLLRFARSLPPQSASRLEFVTMSLIGKPRVSSVAISDIRPVPSSQKGLFKKVNFVRVDQPPASSTITEAKGKSSSKPLTSAQWKIQQQQLKDGKQHGWRQKILSWTRFKTVKEFYVTDVPQKTAEKRGVKEARVWEEIRGLIEKRAIREAERRKGGR